MVRITRERQNFNFKIIVAFLFALILFLLGIFSGYYLNQKKIENIENLEKDILVSLQDIDVLFSEINESNICENKKYLDRIGEELDKYAIKLSFLEENLGKNNEMVIRLKKPYTILLIKHYLLTREIKNCEKIVIILFLYSNKPEYISLSENEGIILGYIKKKYGNEKIKVYSLDVELGLKNVENIIEKYNIKKYPSLIINDEVYSYLDKDKLENIIKDILEK